MWNLLRRQVVNPNSFSLRKQGFCLYKRHFCVAKCLLGCAQTPCVLHPLDAGCAIASLKVDRRFIKIWRKGRGFSCKKYGFMIRLLWKGGLKAGELMSVCKLTNQGRNSVGKTDARLFLYRFQQNVISHSGKSGTVFQTGCERSGNYVQSNGKNERWNRTWNFDQECFDDVGRRVALRLQNVLRLPGSKSFLLVTSSFALG